MLNICYHSRLNSQHDWGYLCDLLMARCQWTLLIRNNSKLAPNLLGLIIMASPCTFLDKHKIDVHNSLLILIERKYLSGMWLGKNKHPKNMCSIEIGLHAQKMSTILSSIVDRISGTLYDHSRSTRIFTSVWRKFWAKSIKILVFPSPISYILGSFNFSLLIWGVFPRFP